MTDYSVFLQVHIPVQAGEAKVRGLGAGLCRLIVDFSATSQPSRHAAEFVRDARPDGSQIGIGAFNAFAAFDSVFGKAARSIALTDNAKLLATETPVDVERALSAWNAELLIVVFGTFGDLEKLRASETNRAPWWKLVTQTPDSAYLARFEAFDPILVYSPTRMALEILGSEARVLSCFEIARRLDRSSA